MANTKNKQEIYTNEDVVFMDLRIRCYKDEATAEHFEQYIKLFGLDERIIILIINYYGEDYATQFKRGVY